MGEGKEKRTKGKGVGKKEAERHFLFHSCSLFSLNVGVKLYFGLSEIHLRAMVYLTVY
jgi:hypothetical protein